MSAYIEKLLSDIPNGILPLVDMPSPNVPLTIHNGDFIIIQNDTVYPCQGTLQYIWIPSPKIKFEGRITFSEQFILDQRQHTGVKVIRENHFSGTGFLTGFSTSSQSQEVCIKGEINRDFLVGDGNAQVTMVRFCLPNFVGLHGQNIKFGTMVIRGRLTLEDETYRIEIDKLPNFEERQRALHVESGFILTHAGRIIKKGGDLYLAEVEEVAKKLHWSLSFVNGYQTSPVCISGMVDDQIKWTRYQPYTIDPHRNSRSWTEPLDITGLPNLWLDISKILHSSDDNDWLMTAFQFYLEANGKGNLAETALTIAQCGLELLYNRLIIEEKGSSKTDITAADKIKDLLTAVGESNSLPSTLINTRAFDSSADGPSMVVFIRNAVVHGNSTKRKKLKKVPAPVRAEVLNLAIFYLEIVLLKRLGYRGQYFNRCLEVQYAAEVD